MAPLLFGLACGALVVAAGAGVGVAAYRSHRRQPEPTLWLAER